MSAAPPLSVCMVSDDFLPAATGVGTHLQSVGRHLVARGHRISLVTTRRPGEPAFEEWHGVRVHRVPTVRIAGFDQGLATAGRLAHILDEEAPQLVHLHYLGFLMLQAMRVARRRGLPLVYTYHMTEDHLTQPWFMRPFRWPIGRAIVHAVNRMDAVISVSEGLTEGLPGKGIHAPLTTISNPVDLPDLGTVVPAPRPPGFLVMYAGRLEPEKNLPLLLRAFAALGLPEARLWIAGRGSQQTALTELARQLGIADRVEFLGFLDRPALARHYLACDVFVLPSLVETQGLVAMEAAWAGRPVVVADTVVSCRELVREGRTGFIVPAASPEPMAARLRELATGGALRARMGAEARELAAQWRPEVVIPALEAVYLAQRQRPG